MWITSPSGSLRYASLRSLRALAQGQPAPQVSQLHPERRGRWSSLTGPLPTGPGQGGDAAAADTSRTRPRRPAWRRTAPAARMSCSSRVGCADARRSRPARGRAAPEQRAQGTSYPRLPLPPVCGRVWAANSAAHSPSPAVGPLRAPTATLDETDGRRVVTVWRVRTAGGTACTPSPSTDAKGAGQLVDLGPQHWRSRGGHPVNHAPGVHAVQRRLGRGPLCPLQQMHGAGVLVLE